MSTKNVRLFFEMASLHTELRNKLKQLSNATTDEYIQKVIQLGEENGYPFMRKHMEQVALETLLILRNSVDVRENKLESDVNVVFNMKYNNHLNKFSNLKFIH